MALAVVLLATASSPERVNASDADIVLKPAGQLPLDGLAVGLYSPDSTLHAPVESLKAEQSWPLTSLRVALNTNPGLCGEHTIAQVLELPNQDGAPVDGPECVFGLLLTAQTDQRTFEIATECGDWIGDQSTCWGYGQTGAFRLTRDRDKAPSKFRLIFPSPGRPTPAPATGGKPEPGDTAGGDPSGQKFGLFLDTLLDDKKEAKGDLWLVWAGATIELSFTR